jgi:CRISPR/Cas system-associated endoribonuclease Cas2
MVNFSIASRILVNETEGIGLWIIVYDFLGFKPNPNFWVNLRRISNAHGGNFIQYSVYQTRKKTEAKAVKELIVHYGGDAQVFECIEPTYS